MKFHDARKENRDAVELVCLILSLAAIFFQIWILSTSLEAYFQGHGNRLLPAVIFSLVSFLVCALTAWTTGMSFMKGMDEGRTRTYKKHTQFKE
jgi:hypothetical protein